MRVISGSARGRVLKTLEGEHTRPTADKVKESIFNIIQFELEGRRVLDLFSGSGQLAIEAVSRGAESAVAVDNSKRAVDIIKQNIKNCGFEDKISLSMGDYADFLSRKNKFDLIFLDPPYDSGHMARALELIREFDILSKRGIIVCETDSSTDICGFEDEQFSVREYKYGRVKLTVIRSGD
ncbi:MAG: 16S rRNA (guanine(966)-N(2))-methyltransferase RsmD [Oscillospiraceae bacterium]|nr:16S rRNA (guanine(966)-N(2))-methyltransferase RsmD [Oscillospiraceae bacterium]